MFSLFLPILIYFYYKFNIFKNLCDNILCYHYQKKAIKLNKYDRHTYYIYIHTTIRVKYVTPLWEGLIFKIPPLSLSFINCSVVNVVVVVVDVLVAWRWPCVIDPPPPNKLRSHSLFLNPTTLSSPTFLSFLSLSFERYAIFHLIR